MADELSATFILGVFQDKDNDNKCTKCSAGSISTKEGSTSCTQCTGLTYSNSARTNCDSCPEHCASCHNTNGTCIKCESGYGLNTTSNTCTRCQKGEYSDGGDI